jgi:ribonuclease HI
MKRKKSKSIGKPKSQLPIVFYCDGSGARPDGKGSAIAWFREDTGREHAETVDGLTNNEAEYRAIISALQSALPGSTVKIFSDAQLVIYQICGVYRVNDPELAVLRNSVNDAVLNRNLNVEFIWIPRGQNRADRLLRRKEPFSSSDKPGAAA